MKILLYWLQARPILRDRDRFEELADPRLGGQYPKDDFVRVCTIAAACVSPEANQRPTMGEVVQSLKMVQRSVELQESLPTPRARPNIRQSSTTYESDATSSMFSSGPFSGLSPLETENIPRTAVFSEDLHEGRWLRLEVVVVELFSVDPVITHSKVGGAICLSNHLGRSTCKFNFYSPPSRN
jgi:hypothetical protein